MLFTTGFLQASYRRFVERRLREEFGFEGSPVHVTMRLREKRAGGRPAGRAGAGQGGARPGRPPWRREALTT